MFDRLLDLLIQLGNKIIPFEVIRVYQRGVVLRFGKCHRVLEPGIHWKWPLAEEVMEINTVITTIRLPPQTLTTKDNISVVVAAIIKYQVINAQAYVSEIWDANDVLADTSMGAIRQAVGNMTYAELIDESPEKAVIEIVRNEVNRYGFKVHRITFTDIGKVRSFRLIQQGAKDIEN